MKCRCTMTVPQCNLGHLLFTELIQVQGLWSTAFEEKKKEMWQRYIQAHHAYRRHIEGWHDNDIRVERVMGGWEIKHLDGKPLLYFRAAEEAHLQQWFVEQGFSRYAMLGENELQDQYTGYYRKPHSPATAHAKRNAQALRGSEQPGAALPSTRAEDIPSNMVLPTIVDPKMRIAMLITTLVNRFSRPLTLVDRLLVQRRAVDLLLHYGVQSVGPREIQIIDGVIEEALHMKETTMSQVIGKREE